MLHHAMNAKARKGADIQGELGELVIAVTLFDSTAVAAQAVSAAVTVCERAMKAGARSMAFGE